MHLGPWVKVEMNPHISEKHRNQPTNPLQETLTSSSWRFGRVRCPCFMKNRWAFHHSKRKPPTFNTWILVKLDYSPSNSVWKIRIGFFPWLYTLPETKSLTPENRASQKDISSSNHWFLELFDVSFKEGKFCVVGASICGSGLVGVWKSNNRHFHEASSIKNCLLQVSGSINHLYFWKTTTSIS